MKIKQHMFNACNKESWNQRALIVSTQYNQTVFFLQRVK